MKDKTKNIIVTIAFLIIVIGGLFLNCITKDKKVSLTERRRLKQFPTISIANIFDGKFSEELESYGMDQFVGRDNLRKIKAITNFNVLFQKDTNGLFIKNGAIYKQTGPLKTNEIEKAIGTFNDIYDNFLKNNDVYFSIIPDKNYYLKDNELRMDYEKLEDMMKKNLSNMKYINLFNILNENDYYKTDIHWKQENLSKVAITVANNMKKSIKLEDTKIKSKGKFYGVYSGQISLNQGMYDDLKYVTSPVIQNSKTLNFETNKVSTIYDENKFNTSTDKYDYFLSGPTPLIIITNESAEGSKELIIFRDSFASSLAPLLLEAYSKITLIDIRYMSSKYLDSYVDFNNKDVLFLYSTLILNDASMLK